MWPGARDVPAGLLLTVPGPFKIGRHFYTAHEVAPFRGLYGDVVTVADHVEFRNDNRPVVYRRKDELVSVSYEGGN